jgi:hypothetical protein
MAEQTPAPISHELDELTCELIGVCLDTLAETEALAPMVASLSVDGEASCRAFEEDDADTALEAARGFVSSKKENLRAYAVAYDGFVRPDEHAGLQEALLVEFGEQGMPTAYSAFVAYECGATPDQFLCSEPQAAGEEPNLLS